jgi:hypothetical protein
MAQDVNARAPVEEAAVLLAAAPAAAAAPEYRAEDWSIPAGQTDPAHSWIKSYIIWLSSWVKSAQNERNSEAKGQLTCYKKP